MQCPLSRYLKFPLPFSRLFISEMGRHVLSVPRLDAAPWPAAAGLLRLPALSARAPALLAGSSSGSGSGSATGSGSGSGSRQRPGWTCIQSGRLAAGPAAGPPSWAPGRPLTAGGHRRRTTAAPLLDIQERPRVSRRGSAMSPKRALVARKSESRPHRDHTCVLWTWRDACHVSEVAVVPRPYDPGSCSVFQAFRPRNAITPFDPFNSCPLQCLVCPNRSYPLSDPHLCPGSPIGRSVTILPSTLIVHQTRFHG